MVFGSGMKLFYGSFSNDTEMSIQVSLERKFGALLER